MASKRRRKKPRGKNKPLPRPASSNNSLNGAMNAALRPANQKAQEVVTTTTTQVDHFQGPIPAPATLDQYEKILPGAAERIISMAEKEQTHRQHCEKSALEQEIQNHKARNREVARGQWFGLFIGVCAIGCGAWLASIGQPWSGGFIGTGGVIGLVAVFVFSHRTKADKKKE
ncbi:DUF2335 domain-containing protein [Thiolapillus sp.]|uniref:DUF2335 domain-containing protein n=1 Tax=Thiolapillus sp. TaxID=2017437 RepID=UPI003AF57343